MHIWILTGTLILTQGWEKDPAHLDSVLHSESKQSIDETINFIKRFSK